MALAVLGVSHHTAPVEVRERFAFAAEEGLEALLELRKAAAVEEAVLVSTCNRTEIYLHPVHDEAVFRVAEAVLQRKAGPLPAPVTEYLYRRRDGDVPRHLFRVTAGLDSLVMGEAEIQGQVRSAYQRSADAGVDPPLAGPVLNRLFQTALGVGGRVRAETSIGEGAASAASVAVELARKIFGHLGGKRVLVLGAGETGELVVEALGRHGVEGVLVANRTYERAADLAARLCGRAVELQDLAGILREVDIVVASTAAPHAIVTRRILHEAFPEGVRDPLLIIDIAIPRDVDPEVGEEPSVFLYNVDDLRKIVDETLERRRDARTAADTIIDEGAEDFLAWYATLEVVPVIRALRSRGEAIREAEMERFLGRLSHLGEEERAELEAFSRRLLNKLLHEPTVRVRRGAADGRASEVVRAATYLFGLSGTGLAGEGRTPEDRGRDGNPVPDDRDDDDESDGQ
ncbi:MAG TPA: glutamyl-tRNA reductase [Longimicrobiales bacterium]|nr:glutamyl-tRNA reductase [Longimicrobiales bacterium]